MLNVLLPDMLKTMLLFWHDIDDVKLYFIIEDEDIEEIRMRRIIVNKSVDGQMGVHVELGLHF